MSYTPSSKKKVAMPRVDAYKISDTHVAIICPYCSGLHVHGDAEGSRDPHCISPTPSSDLEYWLKPSVPAPDWVMDRINGNWRSAAADALATIQYPQHRYAHRHHFLDVLVEPFRLYPEFADQVTEKLASQDEMRVIAEYSVIEEMLRSTGEQNIQDAAQTLLKRII